MKSKIILLFLFCFTLIYSSTTFDEKRQQCLDVIYNYIDKKEISSDTTVKKYIKEQYIDSKVYTKVLSINEFDMFELPKLAYEQLKYITFSSQPNVAQIINPKATSSSAKYSKLFGVAMHDEDYYIILYFQ